MEEKGTMHIRAMTIVEIVDQNGGFNWVRKVMKTKSKPNLIRL